jgi:hypothetical protein
LAFLILENIVGLHEKYCLMIWYEYHDISLLLSLCLPREHALTSRDCARLFLGIL